tara:strand:- start:370 stop:1623 length:1254 start_codon:yes stop_codon:yes gene_type:complete
MKFSKFASRFNSESGIVQLMDDLGDAMTDSSDLLMLGGGNPSHIPSVQESFRESLLRLIENQSLFSRTIGNYELPQGNQDFINAIVEMMNKQYDWNINSNNVALTIGSQSAFFFLFNMLGGEYDDGTYHKILLPITPEYIGYSDVGLTPSLFYSYRPVIEKIDKHLFKYHINFDKLAIKKNTGAICVSRPTNPTGNVITDNEMKKLQLISENNNIPLIIDNAYGEPFPNIIFTETKPFWNRNTIFCMSLSKIGMPGTRTGIVIANEEIIKSISNMNAVVNLATANFGAVIANDLVRTGKILHLSKSIIKPFYKKKLKHALNTITKEFDNIDYYIHLPEGAIFLWLWLPTLPISSDQLYERLKLKGVLVISGSNFFPGLEDDWEHKHQCIRVTYSMDERIVEDGIKVIADEIRKISSA